MLKKRNTLLKFAFLTIKISLLTFFALSCATSGYTFTEIDIAVEQADFPAAVEEIKKAQKSRSVLYNEKNAVSLFLDKGLLEHYAGNFAASSADLQNAEKLIEEAYTKSISENFFSYIINDNTREYPGEDFEDIYLNIFNALNYYSRGNTEGALVEVRKLSMTNGKLGMLARKYNYTDPKTGESLNAMIKRETGIGQIPQTQTVNFSNSALARYLSALFYQADGNTDSARIEFEQVERAFYANRNVYQNQVPAAVEQARNVPKGTARLNVICFTGLSPIKEETIVFQHLPFQHPVLQIAAFKLPDLIRRPSQITRIEVSAGEAGRFNLELIENMGSVIEETFKARYANIYIKTYIRTILKYIAADIAAMETARQKNEFAGFAVALAARAGLDATESADIRMSRYLPDKAYIGGINLDPGNYKVVINYYNGNNLVAMEHRETVVTIDGLNLLHTVNLR